MWNFPSSYPHLYMTICFEASFSMTSTLLLCVPPIHKVFFPLQVSYFWPRLYGLKYKHSTIYSSPNQCAKEENKEKKKKKKLWHKQKNDAKENCSLYSLSIRTFYNHKVDIWWWVVNEEGMGTRNHPFSTLYCTYATKDVLKYT